MIALHGDETGSRDVAARPEAPEVETCTRAGWLDGPKVELPWWWPVLNECGWVCDFGLRADL
ncbi:MAG TPA: hypothetical protein PK156_39440 [Polyangium sp.]|nr:hypothetical protein [Polyangium sp.]